MSMAFSSKGNVSTLTSSIFWANIICFLEISSKFPFTSFFQKLVNNYNPNNMHFQKMIHSLCSGMSRAKLKSVSPVWKRDLLGILSYQCYIKQLILGHMKLISWFSSVLASNFDAASILFYFIFSYKSPAILDL